MKRIIILVTGIVVIATGCQLHTRDLTPPDQPNWQNSFNSTTLENVEVWPYLTPEAELLYSDTKGVLDGYAENMGYHFYLEIKPDRGISNIQPTVIINGVRNEMEHVHGINGGVWFHRELTPTTCNIDGFNYYYEIRYKRWGYSSVQFGRIYSEAEPANSTINLDDIICVAAQGMKPVDSSGYSLRTDFPSGVTKEFKVILSNRTNVDIYCIDASIIEDFTAGYLGCGNEFRIIEHPSYTYPSPISCGSYANFKLSWTPTFYGSASNVPSDRKKAKVELRLTYKYEDNGVWRTDSRSIDLYGLYQ